MYGPEDSPQQTRIRTHIHAYLHTYTPRRQTTPPRLPSVFLLLDGALHGSSLPRPPYCRSIGDGEPDLPAPPIPPYRADGVHAYMLFLQLRMDLCSCGRIARRSPTPLVSLRPSVRPPLWEPRGVRSDPVFGSQQLFRRHYWTDVLCLLHHSAFGLGCFARTCRRDPAMVHRNDLNRYVGPPRLMTI